MNLNGAAGTIGGGASDGSDTVSFTGYTAGRDIVYGGSGTSTKLGLSVAGLQSVSAGNLNIGHSGAGSITTGADVTLSGVGSAGAGKRQDITLSKALGGASYVTVSVDGTGTLSTVSGAGLDGTTELRLIGNKMALAGALGAEGIKSTPTPPAPASASVRRSAAS
jgi:hypothetical protein